MKILNIYVSSYVNDIHVGGYGVVIENGNKTQELLTYYYPTTKYRIMLSGVTTALSVLSESCEVTMYIDSEYVVNSINKGWVAQWHRQNWRRNDGTKAKNADLWEKLLNLLQKHNVYFICVKKQSSGQSHGIQHHLHCEKLAVEAVRKGIKHAYNHKIMF